jgi:phosphoribosyl 1,2-cyclic phosphodiesterase
MKIILGGVRGTSCIAQSDYMMYGGDTTSVLVEGDAGERVIIDAGTGIRKLGQRIEFGKVPSSILLLVTHYHLDHIMGLPSLALLYRGGIKFLVGSVRWKNLSARDILPQIMAQPFWPVQLEDLKSSFAFIDWQADAPIQPYSFGNLEVRWCAVSHPGGCTAFRVDEPATGKSMVFATDFEWGQSLEAEKKAFLRWCCEPGSPSLLVMDGQFSRQQYPRFIGWGHSTWEDGVEVAREVRARRLVITHHGPQNPDSKLAIVETELIRAMSDAKLGRDGMEIAL